MMKRFLPWLAIATVLMIGPTALGGVFELGGGFSLNKTTYNAGSFTKSRSYSGTLGYYFTQESELEFMYQDSTTQNYVEGVEDVTYHDRIYSLNLVYYMMSEEESSIRPYFRGGLGQLNRDASGNINGVAAPGRLDQVSAILGLGVKAKISARFGFKAEATTYLTGGNISTWQDNLNLNIGGSFFF